MFRICRTVLALAFALSLCPTLSQAEDTEKTGAVFVMTNNAEHNEVIAYHRNADGSLTDRNSFATGGRGSGGLTDPLASQGSLTLTEDGSLLLAVNAGSGDISVFRITGSTLTLLGTTPCGGSEPVAVVQRRHLVYVVNAGGTSNVTGFHLTRSGVLKAIPHSTAFLTTGNSGASSLAFSPDGQTILVTEKLTNNIDAFAVQPSGVLGPIVATPSAGPGLFGVAFAPSGVAITTETGPAGAQNASALSSYVVNSSGTLSVVDASVPTRAAATCWHVITSNGKYVYTSNPGSGTISGLSIDSTGTLTAIDNTVLATLPSGSGNLDIAATTNSKYLYTIDSGTGAVSAFGVKDDGTITTLPGVSGLAAKAGYNGIAAF